MERSQGEIDEWLDSHNYSSLQEIRGLYIRNAEERAKLMDP